MERVGDELDTVETVRIERVDMEPLVIPLEVEPAVAAKDGEPPAIGEVASAVKDVAVGLLKSDYPATVYGGITLLTLAGSYVSYLLGKKKGIAASKSKKGPP